MRALLIATVVMGCGDEDRPVQWRCNVEPDKTCHYYLVDSKTKKVIRFATSKDMRDAGLDPSDQPPKDGGRHSSSGSGDDGQEPYDPCCKHCGESQPCGDSCISPSRDCKAGVGCACR